MGSPRILHLDVCGHCYSAARRYVEYNVDAIKLSRNPNINVSDLDCTCRERLLQLTAMKRRLYTIVSCLSLAALVLLALLWYRSYQIREMIQFRGHYGWAVLW